MGLLEGARSGRNTEIFSPYGLWKTVHKASVKTSNLFVFAEGVPVPQLVEVTFTLTVETSTLLFLMGKATLDQSWEEMKTLDFLTIMNGTQDNRGLPFPITGKQVQLSPPVGFDLERVKGGDQLLHEIEGLVAGETLVGTSRYNKKKTSLVGI